ncbi:amidohydrolase [bacterium]|nr:amidohydrolase [bacterium]
MAMRERIGGTLLGIKEGMAVLITTKRMRALHRCATASRVLLVSTLLACFAPWASSADVILLGGHIYRADAQSPEAEAVVIEGDTIVYVGSRQGAERYRTPATRVINTEGKMVLPGFHDAHLHTFMGGRSLVGCDVANAPDIESTEAILKSCLASSSSSWLVAEGLNLAFFGESGPLLDWLNAIAGDRPMLLRASDGHSVAVNTVALKMANITAATSAPSSGVIERDEYGEPSGTFRESAMALVEQVVPQLTEQERLNVMRTAIDAINKAGITSVFDAWVGAPDIVAYRTLEAQNELSIRVRAALAYGYGDLFAVDTPFVYEQQLKDREALSGDRFTLAAVKLFIDGVLEGETAALVSPYLHKSGYRGELTYPQAELNNIVANLANNDLQVYTHAVGDGGVRVILNAFEFAEQALGRKDLRHHISHLQLIHPDDHGRFAELNVVANFQALWAVPDDWVIQLNLPVVGLDRVHRMYPIASIAESGAMLVGGSDWNVSSLNPLDAIEVAVLRHDWQANDALTNDELSQLDVLNRSERVDLDTMLKAYTINAAWSMHQEALTGSLTPGKRADIVVLSEDLFAIPPQLISTVKVEKTFIDGQLVYQR